MSIRKNLLFIGLCIGLFSIQINSEDLGVSDKPREPWEELEYMMKTGQYNVPDPVQTPVSDKNPEEVRRSSFQERQLSSQTFTNKSQALFRNALPDFDSPGSTGSNSSIGGQNDETQRRQIHRISRQLKSSSPQQFFDLDNPQSDEEGQSGGNSREKIKTFSQKVYQFSAQQPVNRRNSELKTLTSNIQIKVFDFD